MKRRWRRCCRTYLRSFRRRRVVAGEPKMAAKPISAEDLEHVLAETRGAWEEMRGQRVFITGGTGFFGCWLVESFCHVNRELGLGARATMLSRDPAKFAAKCPHMANDP